MTVHKVGFLLDRSWTRLFPLEYLRELTQNAIEAVQRTGKPGQIVWDVDWISYDLGGPMKVCIVDTGDGMTGDDMIRFINQLSSSGTEQSFTGNDGVGAKIAAATKNPAGVIDHSWKNGNGNMIQLEKNSNTGEYGLRQWELKDGTYSHYVPLDDAVKPRGDRTARDQGDPDGVRRSPTPPSRHRPTRMRRRLQGGYPSTSTPGTSSSPLGSRSRLAKVGTIRGPTRTACLADDLRTEALPRPTRDGLRRSGTVGRESSLVDTEDEPAITNNSGYIELAGHVAALYQNELYDRATSRSGTAMLQRFGVLFGCRNVVLYVEPVAKDGALTTDTARTTYFSMARGCRGKIGRTSFARTCPSSWRRSSARRHPASPRRTISAPSRTGSRTSWTSTR